ncbi:terpene synthase family protein [Streptomyces sp. NPDC059092]|uniref:terpene synthase family protein n=1 Tax=Streptomyces sp. NPDC059092 TaxID=3346725 RepID=UPI0036CC71DC
MQSPVSDPVLDTVLPRWPFPAAPSRDPADVAAVESGGEEWARRFGLIDSEDAPHPLRLLCAGELVSFGYPRADTAMRVLITQWTMWYFNLDDHFEDGASGTSAEAAEAAAAPLRRIVDAARRHRTMPLAEDSLQHSMSDLLSRTAQVMAPVQFHELLAHLDDYFTSLVVESEYRARGVLPGVDAYITLRRDTGPVLPLLDFVEQAESVRLPVRFYGTPEYTEMIGCAADIASWINDLCSVSKELDRPDAYNLVVLLHRQERKSLQDAAVETLNRIEQRVRSLEGALDAISGSGPDVGSGTKDGSGSVAPYNGSEIEAIRAWADGLLCFQSHVEWYLRHARYEREEPHPEVSP